MKKYNQITIMYLLNVKNTLIEQSKSAKEIEKSNIEYDIKCIERSIEDLGDLK